MGYRMILYKEDEVLRSPIICPNNPNHDFNHRSIIKEIEKTGRSMIRYKMIKKYSVEKGER